MSDALDTTQTAVVTTLLQAGKSIKEIAKFADFDPEAVIKVARSADIEPTSPDQQRAKALYQSAEGLSFQEIAKTLTDEGLAGDDGPMHHLTVASWAKNFGWAWGGAGDGEYAPERVAPTVRSRYLLRLSKAVDAELNTPAKIDDAAAAAWTALESDTTRVVQLAIIQGAAQVGVTDLAAVKRVLMDAHGDAIRNTKL